MITRQFNVGFNQNLVIEEIPGCTRIPSYIVSSTDTVNTSICQGDSINIGGNFQTQPGTYFDRYPVVGTCDSLVITNLIISTILPSPPIISGLDTVCVSQQNVIYSIEPVAGATSYQWSVPVGSILNSGAGTDSINILFGLGSGYVVVSAVNNCGVGMPAYYYVTTTSCTGINEISGLTDLNIYPNPADASIYVEYSLSDVKDFKIELKNLLGKSVIQPIRMKNRTGNNSLQIPSSEISNGIYFLELSSGEGLLTLKLIVDHR